MNTSSQFEGPTHRIVELDSGKTSTEVTTSGASGEIQRAINETRGEDGVADLSKLDPEVARLNKGAFNMLMGEEPEEFMGRLSAIVGSENPSDIADAAVAVLGEREAQRQAMLYAGSNPLAAAMRARFESLDTAEKHTAPVAMGLGLAALAGLRRSTMQDHLAEISQTTGRRVGTPEVAADEALATSEATSVPAPLGEVPAPSEVVTTLPSPSPEAMLDRELSLAEKLSLLSGIIGSLDAYDVQEGADGVVTIMPKGK